MAAWIHEPASSFRTSLATQHRESAAQVGWQAGMDARLRERQRSASNFKHFAEDLATDLHGFERAVEKCFKNLL
ncbi:MAG: hypothetical protein FJ083_13690 [Cyanobacteria bacterium K_Offshore_surface_m2_239]|nr:hypothetical protein [Cyanobacteria bacterium K_Offshore_surface_m2_239]